MEPRRPPPALAGALLGFAIVTKIFPGLLGVVWLVRKRWRAVAWTVAFSALFTLGSYAVVGPDPFTAFFEYQLPRIASGEAFSFATKEDLVVAANFGIWGLPHKLVRLGVIDAAQPLANQLTWAYGLFLLPLVAWAARRERPAGDELSLWLAILVLASLRSPVAPNVYSAAPAIWLITLRAKRWSTTPLAVVAVVLAVIALGGLPPLPDPEHTILLWSTGQLAMLAVGLLALAQRKPPTSTA